MSKGERAGSQQLCTSLQVKLANGEGQGEVAPHTSTPTSHSILRRFSCMLRSGRCLGMTLTACSVPSLSRSARHTRPYSAWQGIGGNVQ